MGSREALVKALLEPVLTYRLWNGLTASPHQPAGQPPHHKAWIDGFTIASPCGICCGISQPYKTYEMAYA